MTDESRCPNCRSPRVHSAESNGVVKWYAGSLVGVRYCPFCGHDLLQLVLPETPPSPDAGADK